MLLLAPEYDMDIQARVPPALCALHNFICQHDPSDIEDYLALTPSIMGMDEYLMPDPVIEGATVPPIIQPPGNLTFADPMVDKAVAQIHAPRLEGKSDEPFEKC